jgi:FKBP-type peptidyl-prolyl cis-trans isomerase SlyD
VQAAPQKVVSIEYTLTDDAGQVIDTSDGREPLSYLHGANNIVPGLEKAIEGKGVGESVEVSLTPEEGYGVYDKRLIQNIAVRKLPEKKPKVGMQFRLETAAGPRGFIVTAVRGDYATLDGNHPLAGKALNFKVKVVAIRDATADENTHGHAHGAGGHAH